MKHVIPIKHSMLLNPEGLVLFGLLHMETQ